MSLVEKWFPSGRDKHGRYDESLYGNLNWALGGEPTAKRRHVNRQNDEERNLNMTTSTEQTNDSDTSESDYESDTSTSIDTPSDDNDDDGRDWVDKLLNNINDDDYVDRSRSATQTPRAQAGDDDSNQVCALLFLCS
jgi:hypothetical protein